MRTKANGITFNYEIEGPDGAPFIMFSNSLATDLTMWDPQAADFKGTYRILRYDQRGHGGTDAPAGRYTYPQLVADALALLNSLKIERTHFVGLSMGGATAAALAELHPTASTAWSSATRPACPPRRPPSNGRSVSPWPRRAVWRRWSIRRSRGGFRPRLGGEAGACRKGAGDDFVDPGQRLHRLRGGARRPRLQHEDRDREAPGAVHRRQQRRRYSRGDEGHAGASSPARAMSSSRAQGTY